MSVAGVSATGPAAAARSDGVLALDAGTSGGRAAVFDARGRIRGEASVSWRAITPPGLAPFGQAYEDPDALRAALFDAARRAIEQAGPTVAIRAVAVAGARIACGFLDGQGHTVYLGPNGDVRAVEAGDLDDLSSDALYETTGRFPPWMFAPARLRWFAAREPERFARIEHVLGFGDWFAHALGAAPRTDPTAAADLMMLSVEDRRRATAGDDARYPEVVEPGTPIGALSPAAAEALGVNEGITIVQGGGDTQLALLGAGVIEQGTAVVAGSTAPLMRVAERPVRDPARRLWLDPHAIEGRWLLEANLGEMGSAHAWLVTLLLGGPRYQEAEALADAAPIGCGNASTHLGPRAMDLRALNTGRLAGILMPFGETRGGAPPDRGALLRASLEGAAFAIEAGRAWLDAACPEPPGDAPMVLAGGLSQSRCFAQIVASVTGQPVRAAGADATLRGAAACAAVGVGWHGSLADAARALGAEMRTYAPDEDDVEAYEDAFERWTEREAHLEDL